MLGLCGILIGNKQESWRLHQGNKYYHSWAVRKDFKMATKYTNLASQSGHVEVLHLGGEMWKRALVYWSRYSS